MFRDVSVYLFFREAGGWRTELLCTALFVFWLRLLQNNARVMYICAILRGFGMIVIISRKQWKMWWPFPPNGASLSQPNREPRKRKLVCGESRVEISSSSCFLNQYHVMTFWQLSANVHPGLLEVAGRQQDSATIHLPLSVLIHRGSCLWQKTVAGHRCHEN